MLLFWLLAAYLLTRSPYGRNPSTREYCWSCKAMLRTGDAGSLGS
jgi:hypothetical protein